MVTTRAKTTPGLSVVASMRQIVSYSLTQLGHFTDGRDISATPREAELIQRQAEDMAKVAARWAELAASVLPEGS